MLRMPSTDQILVGAALGIFGLLGGAAYATARHAHTCPRCARRWVHSSLLILSKAQEDRAHACPGCGTDWRWKDGHLSCATSEAARADDAQRVRRGQPARYVVAPHVHAI